jgi:hypothetical protein
MLKHLRSIILKSGVKIFDGEEKWLLGELSKTETGRPPQLGNMGKFRRQAMT